MECRRCGGSGELNIKLGKPDPLNDTHSAYTGLWCLYPPATCGHCKGRGWEKHKRPPPPYRGPVSIRNEDKPERETT